MPGPSGIAGAIKLLSVSFLISLPFGYWRAQAARFSRQWSLAIHLPVPLVFALRIFSGLGWQLISFPRLDRRFFGVGYAAAS